VSQTSISTLSHNIRIMFEKNPSCNEPPSNISIDSESRELKRREGGRTAWLTVLGSILVYYSSFGILNSFGFFQNYYANDFLKGSPVSTIAFIGTVQMALMNSLAAVSGAICDRYGVKVSDHQWNVLGYH
jgi:MCP family monocarboxylic acid transporter-like MFS transporter 10